MAGQANGAASIADTQKAGIDRTTEAARCNTMWIMTGSTFNPGAGTGVIETDFVRVGAAISIAFKPLDAAGYPGGGDKVGARTGGRHRDAYRVIVGQIGADSEYLEVGGASSQYKRC